MEHLVHMPESEYIYKMSFYNESVQDQFHLQDVFKSENATWGMPFELQVEGYEGG